MQNGKIAIEKAKTIKLFILDVDGVLTSGTIYYGNQNIELKGFNIHDGLGLKLLQKTGISIAIITAKKSEAVAWRLRDLAIEHVYAGFSEKLPAYETIKEKLGLRDQEIAYMGDDLPDLPVLRRVNFAITVPAAPDIIKQNAHWVTKKKAGRGAVREACELILKAQNTYQTVIDSYLKI